MTLDPPTALLSRRALLGTLATLAPATAAAQVRTPGGPAPTAVQDVLLKLLRRTTYGITNDDVTSAYGLGFERYIEDQFDANLPDAACNQRLAAFPTIAQTTQELYPLDSTLVNNEIAYATITRAIYSKRQLFERMVEFWSDHFNTSINVVSRFKTAEVRDVYRTYAFGTFSQMLHGSAASTAMILYLNSDRNTRTAPNQNYAREVMELHTLGVDGGYTQQDVAEVARCFTGWRYYGNTNDARAGTSYFDRTRHDLNTKTVLGNTIAANGGVEDGLRVLQILAEHPSTARFVSTKLLRWFLDYEPSSTLVADVAAEFTRKGGDMKAVLRRILTYDQVMAAPPLFKRPHHYVMSCLRALRADMTRLDTLRGTYLAGMGQTPFTWGPPDGYPHDYAYWGTLVLPRWNFAFNLPNGSVGGAVVDVPLLMTGATTAAQIADRIDTLVFRDEMPRADKAALVTYLRPDPPTLARIRDAIGLALASPAFQWH
jgi:uncharacterized protein (DUF1800 family)